jgi:hypothetical protein
MKYPKNDDKLPKIECSNGRKYGECCIAEQLSVKMVDGTFIQTLQIKDKPRPLKKDEALIYYTQKLRSIWEKKVHYV